MNPQILIDNVDYYGLEQGNIVCARQDPEIYKCQIVDKYCGNEGGVVGTSNIDPVIEDLNGHRSSLGIPVPPSQAF